MASIQELVVTGEKLGLKAEALQSFVKEQQMIARHERAKEREFEQAKIEANQAFEKAKIEANQELEKAKIEAN